MRQKNAISAATQSEGPAHSVAKDALQNSILP